MKKLFVCLVVATEVALLSVGSAFGETITPKCYTTNTRIVKKSLAVMEVSVPVTLPLTDAPPEPAGIEQVEKTRGLIFTADKTVVPEGECVTFSGVLKESSGFLYVFNIDNEGTAWCLYPNRYVPDGTELRLQDGDRVVLPAPDAAFCFGAIPPFGKERIYAVLTNEPINPALVNAKSFVLESATKVDAVLLEKSVIPTLVRRKADITYIEIVTIPKTP